MTQALFNAHDYYSWETQCKGTSVLFWEPLGPKETQIIAKHTDWNYQQGLCCFHLYFLGVWGTMGSNVPAHLLGQPSLTVRTQLVTISKQGKQKWQAQSEESRAGAPKHPHIAFYTAKTSSRRHQQEPCPDVLSNSLLIWIASALRIQLNHVSDFCCPWNSLKYTVKTFFFF